jgi:hypothetical protein
MTPITRSWRSMGTIRQVRSPKAAIHSAGMSGEVAQSSISSG